MTIRLHVPELGATPLVEAQFHGFPWDEVRASYLYFLTSGHRRWLDLQFGSFGGRCRRHLYHENGHDEATEHQRSHRHSLPDPHDSRFLDSSASSRTMVLPNMPGGDDNMAPARTPRSNRVELGIGARDEHRWKDKEVYPALATRQCEVIPGWGEPMKLGHPSKTPCPLPVALFA